MDKFLEEVKVVKKIKDAVVILPCKEDKILLQLRDFNKDIVHPGKWGFFGGSIERRESPEEAAKRELWEEIAYQPNKICLLGCFQIPTEHNKLVYVFYCKLDLFLEELKLGEGLDFGLFSSAEIFAEQLYSKKMNRYFPLVSTPFVLNTINRVSKIMLK